MANSPKSSGEFSARAAVEEITPEDLEEVLRNLAGDFALGLHPLQMLVHLRGGPGRILETRRQAVDHRTSQ